MDMTTPSLFWQIRLENTRLLVKGVERLHLGYQRRSYEENGSEKLSWQLSDLKDFVEKEYRNSIQDGGYLAQNPYADLFRFRFQVPNCEKMKSEDSSRLSGMILLYHQLQVLEDIPSDQLAEAYEILCDSIRSILEADMCYLVSHHLTETHMLCASSIMQDDLDTQLGSKEAGELLDQLKEREKFREPVEGIFLSNDDTESTKIATSGNTVRQNPDTLIISIMLYDKKGKPWEEQIYLICQRRSKCSWNHDIEQTILRIRDTLFLRGKLARALARDLTKLLAITREFRGIHRKSPESGPLKILHISDLHVTEKNYKELKTYIKKMELKDGPFDFLVITGDVVQGRYAAGDLENNYTRAAEVIRALAFKMWSKEQNGKQILSQDWKRRTIVIPGNHDYASMNELETQHGENHRASESGRPATQEGSVMAKFTYYINFVRKLLDIDIGDLIDSGLNELRCYDKMGVAFLCFNTSIMANPARNNKVHLATDFARHAISQKSSEISKNGIHTVVFLGHHGPSYKIDYVSDEYLEDYICHTITQKFAEAFSDVSGDVQFEVLKQLKNEMETLKGSYASGGMINNDFVQSWLQRNNVKELPKDIEKRVVECRKRTRLYSDLTFLVEQNSREPMERDINERYQKIVSEVKRAALLSRKDQSAYNSVFDLLKGQFKDAIYLSGHTHVWAVDTKKKWFVAKRFHWVRTEQADPGKNELQQIHMINYGVCSIQPNEVKYKKVKEIVS